MQSNEEKYPEAWNVFINEARNIQNEPDLNHLGNYRIPHPTQEEEFIYADHPGVLFNKFRMEFYKPNAKSPSVYGKIQWLTTLH